MFDILTEGDFSGWGHQLVLASSATDTLPFQDLLSGVARRRGKSIPELLGEGAVAANLTDGGLVCWALIDFSKSTFSRLTALRKGLGLLLAEKPRRIAVSLSCDAEEARWLASACTFTLLANLDSGWVGKSKPAKATPLETLGLVNAPLKDRLAPAIAAGFGNRLARELTTTPPNLLTPRVLRDRIGKLGKDYGFKQKDWDLDALLKLGAGAFCAVAQGSGHRDAAVVRLRYRPKDANKHIALVGKGVCFDTGGNNLKPARHMQGMHEDMNGAAVVLGIMAAAANLNLPVQLDAWLAIADNSIGPLAYRPGDVVTAVNGCTIEVVHTDAEGRMMLADTLALAAKDKPDEIISFATLTGSMQTAVGTRYSGVLGNDTALVTRAVAASHQSGERLCAFPVDEDYDEALESKVADVKQCTMDSDADHILAYRFLERFAAGRPWLHLDLSASRHEGGLGAVAGDVTGFGVAWGLQYLGGELFGDAVQG